MYNHYKMMKGCEFGNALNLLPRAERLNLFASKDLVDSAEPVSNFKGVKVTDWKGRSSFVNCPTNCYHLVQHADVFRPIIEGMTVAGVRDFQFVFSGDSRRMQMLVYTGGEGEDSVRLGFKVINSFDGSKALSYGLRFDRKREFVEIVGYRQVCSNGMIVRVPLHEADFVRPELKVKIDSLFDKQLYIRHTNSADSRIKEVQFVVEAVSLLREPIDLMIKAGRNWKLDDIEKVKLLVRKHVSKRYEKAVLSKFEDEDDDLWGLYNAITWVASHDDRLKEVTRDNLLNSASGLLLELVNNE